MFKSFIGPSLEYADVVWDNITEDQCATIESLQKDCLRTITRLTKSVATTSLYKASGLIGLKQRLRLLKLNQFHKNVYDTNSRLTDHVPTWNPHPSRANKSFYNVYVENIIL